MVSTRIRREVDCRGKSGVCGKKREKGEGKFKRPGLQYGPLKNITSSVHLVSPSDATSLTTFGPILTSLPSPFIVPPLWIHKFYKTGKIVFTIFNSSEYTVSESPSLWSTCPQSYESTGQPVGMEKGNRDK